MSVATAELAQETARDHRYRSRMSASMRAVDEQLDAWGRWNRKGLTHLGYPAIAVLMRLGSRSTAPPDMPDSLLHVERAILELAPLKRRVIVCHYTYWQPIEVSARYCSMTAHAFRKLLERARLDLSHTIS